MATGPHEAALSSVERRRLAALRTASSLAELVELTGADDAQEAYFTAKDEWSTLRDEALPPASRSLDHLPGTCVTVDGTDFWIHGVTHADTDAEGAFLRDHVASYLQRDEAVYCEQGVRPMYFDDFSAVYEMDDYRWALRRCAALDADSRLGGLAPGFEGLLEDVRDAADGVRTLVFSLVHSGGDVYGEAFERALGDVASEFLTSHEDVATGKDFEAFRRSRRAAADPRFLGRLQRYYRTQFLPQPIERAWLRRHDPGLEVVSHGRNERMADYAVFHAADADAVHLVVGAAHQPGVVYYLREHRAGRRDVEGFDLVE